MPVQNIQENQDIGQKYVQIYNAILALSGTEKKEMWKNCYYENLLNVKNAYKRKSVFNTHPPMEPLFQQIVV